MGRSSTITTAARNAAPAFAGEAHGTVMLVQYSNPDFYPHTYYASRLLAGQGYRVVICCRADSPAVIAKYGADIEVHRFAVSFGGARAPFGFASFLLQSLRRARISRPALLVGYDLHGLVAAGSIARLLKVPYLYHCYDIFLSEEGMGRFDRRLKSMEQHFVRKAHAVVFPSAVKADLFSGRCAHGAPTYVVANSPPLQERGSSDLLKRRIRENGFDAEFVVYHHGSIGPGKGLIEVVKSMAWWPPGAAFALLGIVHRDEYMAELLRTASALGVAERVHYLGVVQLPQLYAYTRSADLGLFVPDEANSFNFYSGAAVVKLNDYMACGVPFLVSDFPALREIADETGAGIAVNPEPKELGMAVADLLNRPEQRREMAENAYRAHRERYNLERQYQPILALLRDLRTARLGAEFAASKGVAE